MNAEDIELCFRALRGYWPREWSREQIVVWTEVIAPMDRDTALTGIRKMAMTEAYPTVAAFVALTSRQANANEVIVTDRGMFLPGTGWLTRDKPHARELNEGRADPVRVREIIDKMRADLRRTKPKGGTDELD